MVDRELLAFIHLLPSDLQSLSKDRRIQLYRLIFAQSKLELFKRNVQSIRDKVSRSIFVGFLSGLLSPLSGFLYDSNNSLYFPVAFAAGLLLFLYIVWGIYPIMTIRALEHANSRLYEAETVSELDQIAKEALEAQFGYEFEKVL